MNYELYSKYYDVIMGDRTQDAENLKLIIERYNSNVRSVLEIACGTGGVLKHLSTNFEVFGIDFSLPMLSVAQTSISQDRLSHQDMRFFKLDRRFDAIYCIFDSMNHLSTFSDWQKVFQKVYEHLDVGGVFIFDMHTPLKLKNNTGKSWMTKVGDDIWILNVRDNGFEQTNWQIQIYEWLYDNVYTLHEEDNYERIFPSSQVESELRIFSKVSVFDNYYGDVSENTERLVYVCVK